MNELKEINIIIDEVNKEKVTAIRYEQTLKEKICFRFLEICIFNMVEMIYFYCAYTIMNNQGFINSTGEQDRNFILGSYKFTVIIGMWVKFAMMICEKDADIKCTLVVAWMTGATIIMSLLMCPLIFTFIRWAIVGIFNFVTGEFLPMMWTLKPPQP